MNAGIPVEQAYLYCPHCGANNRSPGQVPFKCEQCDFACFFGPVAAVGALVTNPRNELLLVRRARDPGKGKWGLPGGFVDRDENAEQALVREVWEETRLEVIETEYLLTFPNQYNYRNVVAPVIDLFYVCRVQTLDTLTIADDELEHFEWTHVTATQLDDMAFYSNRVAIEFWLSQCETE